MEMEEEVIDLSELLRLLWSHVLQIVAVGLVAALLQAIWPGSLSGTGEAFAAANVEKEAEKQ